MTSDGLCDISVRFETLSLGELFAHWSNLLWLNGMRPMLQSMLQLDLTMSENIVLRQLQHQPLTIAQGGVSLDYAFGSQPGGGSACLRWICLPGGKPDGSAAESADLDETGLSFNSGSPREVHRWS